MASELHVNVSTGSAEPILICCPRNREARRLKVLRPDLNRLISWYKVDRAGNSLVTKYVAVLILIVSSVLGVDAHANCWKREPYREFYGVDIFESWIRNISWDSRDVLTVTGTAIGYMCQKVDARKSVWRPQSFYGKDDVYVRFETYWNNLLQTKSYVVRVDQNSDFSLEIDSSDFFSSSELQRLKDGEEVAGKYFDLVISVPSEKYPVRIKRYRANFRYQNVLKVENRK
jgi:hypothetical protein